MNSYQMAEIMYKILEKKKVVSLEDILAQFEIAPSTAYNVQRTLKMLCEKHPDECQIQIKNRRTVFVWVKEETKQEDKEAEEIEKILNAKPAPIQ